MDKPRELKIGIDQKILVITHGDMAGNYIEKSSYDKLEGELADLKSESYTWIKLEHNKKQIAELTAENERLNEVIERHERRLGIR